MAYGGLIPFKTDPTTPLIADICVATYDSIKLIHVPANLGEDREINRYQTILNDDLGISSTFFNIGSTEYPIYHYDYLTGEFTTQFFKINTAEKIDALLRIFQLFAKRSVDANKLLETFLVKRQAFVDKLKIAAAGTKYDSDSVSIWLNFDLISGYPNDVATYKNIIFDWVSFILNIDLNTTEYLSWINYELLPVGTPTYFKITFQVNSTTRMALVNRITEVIDDGNCCNLYKLLYQCFTDILTY